MTGRCAFLTLQERGDFVIDDDVAVPALEAAGWRVDTVPWQQRSTPWEDYDLVIVRSTWDYWDDTESFLLVLETIDEATQLANPLSLMRWNLSKTYLRDLESRGVATVPSHWFERLAPEDLARARQRFQGEGLVIKPQVGGNGQGVMRLPASEEASADARALDRFSKTPGMLQPFRPSVLSEGEASMFYFDGEFSHAIVKRPAKGEFRSQEERGAEIIAMEPSPALRAAGDHALASLPTEALYARVDLISAGERGHEVVELELIEPSLYFRTDAASPARFAGAVERWCARHHGDRHCG